MGGTKGFPWDITIYLMLAILAATLLILTLFFFDR